RSGRDRDPTSGETTLQLPVVRAEEPEPAAQPEPAPQPAADVRPEPINLFEPVVPPRSLPDPTEPRPADPLAADPDDLEATPVCAEVTSGWSQAPVRSARGGPVAAGVGAGQAEPSAFVTHADAMWQAAARATEGQTAAFTRAGLPKR